MILNRAEMADLAGDRETQAARALADAETYKPGSTERRFAAQTAAELRNHANQLRDGINPYEGDDTLWIPRGDGR